MFVGTAVVAALLYVMANYIERQRDEPVLKYEIVELKRPSDRKILEEPSMKVCFLYCFICQQDFVDLIPDSRLFGDSMLRTCNRRVPRDGESNDPRRDRSRNRESTNSTREMGKDNVCAKKTSSALYQDLYSGSPRRDLSRCSSRFWQDVD